MSGSIDDRIKRDILLTFLVIALLFVAVGFFMQLRWRNDHIDTVYQLLDAIVSTEQSDLANELFERRITALRLRLQDMVSLQHVISISLYDIQFRRLVHVTQKGAAESGRPAPELPAADLRAGGGYRVAGGFDTLFFTRQIRAMGENMGWLAIVYDLSVLRGQLRMFFIFLSILLLVTLLSMLTLLRWRLRRFVIAPLRELGAAVSSLEAGRLLPLDNLEGSGREVGGLARTFQSMTDRLNQSYRRLDETNRALRDSEQRFKSVFDHAPYAIVVTSLEDGRLLDANEVFIRRWGISKEPSGRLKPDRLSMVPPREAASIRRAVIKEGGVFNRDMEILRPDGSWEQILFSSVPITFGSEASMLSMTVNVTERRRAEDELRKSQEKFRTLFELSPEAILLVHLDSEAIHDVNKAFTGLYGYSREECLGRTTLALGIYQETAERAAIFRRLRAGEHLENAEVGVRHKNGTALICSLSSITLTLGGESFLLTVMRNITETRLLQEMMVQTEKMVSMGGIAAGIAHEINNPLGIILQAAQNLENRTRIDFAKNRAVAESVGLDLAQMNEYLRIRKLDRFIGDIQSAALRAADIVRHMLDFSRRSDAKRGLCDLEQLIYQALSLARSDYDLEKCYDFKKIQVDVRVAENVPSISCIATEIEQVFLNLLRNAAQAIAEAEPPVVSPRIDLSVTGLSGAVRIVIADNGPGMTEAIRRRIFEPFYTTKPPGIGTGLGLSVSYFIITQSHRGRMRAESPPGGGSRFIIELPADSDPKGEI
ncbi:HAMP domain-containing histidine kinase [Desulfofustis glycolicus]|uniref:histidine kinase n=1 Tax=Desulfofustis glycolicus DSM 9705 TaxID=1121409 RepID=A0A1M5V7S3_9BACT|nr:HAMP domain-containing histidine kinase [Desulfofustis glycolicus]MCB2214928.1 HAMP domain-containing histidine kinase [Desulfobulbaceae bacterium]SHH71188.1 PAS domain S-box-containing protein [Desulfofustis glycolicus DSM 9705]